MTTEQNDDAAELQRLQEECRKSSDERMQAINKAGCDAANAARLVAAEQWDNEHRDELQRASKRIAELREKLSVGARYPIGTELVEWRKRYDKGESVSQGRWKLTGRRAVVEIITSESAHPQNRIRKAHIGEFIARILRRDGNTGNDYGLLDDDWLQRWRRSGEQPE